jgi:predicted kinase
MPPYIVIRGPLGVGKTTIAKALARRLNGLYISIDDVLAENGLDIVDEGEPCIPAKNFITAQNLVLSKAKDGLKRGRPVIFDGNFYHHEQLTHLAEALPPDGIVVTLTAPLSVCIARDARRAHTYGEGAAAAVHWLVSRVEAGIVIETEGMTVEETVAEIRKHLHPFDLCD